MKRYLKPLLVALSLIAALFLTVYHHDGDGGIGLTAQRPSAAAPGRKASAYNLGALKIFNVALVRVKDNYVKPELIKPRQMLLAALDEVEKTVAEVLVKERAAGKRLDVRVDKFNKQFDVADVDSPWSLSSRMKEILRFIQAHLLKSTEAQDVEYAAINGMLSTLDPHSRLLEPETYNEMKLSTRGEFGGLGIVISMVKGVLTVMNPMKGTPASEAGIKSCDQILKIGEESTVNMTLTQAVERLRGAPGSKVEVTLMREGWSRPVRKTLTRAIIKVPAVKSRMLASKVAYISLSSFQGNSLDDIREHLRKLKQKGMKALVLDLRGNPGGLLDQAVKISDLFIDSGTLVTTVSHAGKRRDDKRAKTTGTEPRYPMAVLVDSGSASASEIVAGALKNLDRAVVIGKRTFGKGTVQVLYDNDDGSALKLTIAEYLTPGDVSIQAVGITPDILTAPVFVREDFIRLDPSDGSRREKDLAKHLSHKKNNERGKPTRTMVYLAEKTQREKELEQKRKKRKNLCLYPDRECKPEDEDEFVLDYQIRLARDLVASAKTWRRPQMLAGANSLFARSSAEQEKKITAALGTLGVDWTPVAATSGEPKIKVAVSSEPRQGEAMACRKTRIKVRVTNTGTAPTSRLMAKTSSTNDLFDERELVFGKVMPGQSRSWTVPISIRDAPSRIDDVVLEFSEENGHVPDPHTFSMAIKGVERPTYAYGYQLIDDLEGNRDGQVQRGEKVRLFVKVKNTGKGAAFRTITALKNLSGVGIFIKKGRFVLGRLEPGEMKTASFTFEVQKSYSMPEFKVELTVYDDALKEYVSNKLKFRVVKAGEAPQQASGAVRVSSSKTQLRAWPSQQAPVVGWADRGAAFRVLGRYPGWYRVQAAPERPAFISSDAVTPGGGARLTGNSRFSPRWQVTPPSLALDIPALATTKKKIEITGTVTDGERVKDMYIFVRNPDAKIEPRKIFYRSNSSTQHPKRMSFSTEVPLWPGANYVSIHARENEDVKGQESVVIYRKKDKLELAKGGKGAKGKGESKDTASK